MFAIYREGFLRQDCAIQLHILSRTAGLGLRHTVYPDFIGEALLIITYFSFSRTTNHKIIIMKTKKFTFRQTVLTRVKSQFINVVEAKTYEKAEKKFKKAFDKKLESRKVCRPIKKFNPKKLILEETTISPEEFGESTVVVEFVEKKKKSQIQKKIYSNKDMGWDLETESKAEEAEEAESK
jgi:hypothetical protein